MRFSILSSLGLGLLGSCTLAILGNSTTTNHTSTLSMSNYTIHSPLPPPAYMVDNTNNYFGVAPDKYSPEIEKPVSAVSFASNITERMPLNTRQSSSYWWANMEHGEMPFASEGYPVWRNVMDFGAKGDGVTDDTAAINLAITSNGRCGFGCNATSTQGAIVYFPAGTYMISAPLVQYYYTLFVGDPTASTRPTIKGMAKFQGIALIDTDVYIHGGNGSEWYINQNQFYRQIRNLIMDLTDMPNENTSGGQTYVPTGIHWQVAQSTSLQNIHFEMPQGGAAIGVFTENGSGGFMSDLTFFGGNIGMRVGSQQFTARNLFFNNPAIAVQMIWDWGWTWQNIVVSSASIAFDCTSFGGVGMQGTGSLTVLDSHFSDVPFAIALPSTFKPAITIDNLLIDGNTPSVVLISGGATILEGTTGPQKTITSWAMGRRYTSIDDSGTDTSGNLNPVPNKPTGLLDASTGFWYTRSKPQYETLSAGSFVSIFAFGAVGDGTGDQSGALNSAFSSAASSGSIVFIPAGIYAVASTVTIPVGSRVVGEAWPQIMATGNTFADSSNPVPVMKVGQTGDVGIVEISDVLFTVQGGTPGAVMVEWNIHESTQGSAAMWDSHVRIGGQVGSTMTAATCLASNTFDPSCAGAFMLMHVTAEASGYFENNWLWVADHDIDDPLQTQINVFAGRGLLVESKSPVWLWASASEHSYLYQYQLLDASNVFLGHMQTESPYYQPTPDSLGVFLPGNFTGDPMFEDCYGNKQCLSAWALLITNSTDIFIYGAGFYSWYVSYDQSTCLTERTVSKRLVQTDFSQGIWMYSQYTKGATECISPLGGLAPVMQDQNRNGFLTAISAWIPLALTGANIGGITAQVDNPTPENLPPIPGLAGACGNVACGQTMTLTPACASAIAVLPDSAANNNPPGPEDCGETCDIFRLITGTCCGTGGSVCFGIEIPPGQAVPAPFPITVSPPPSVTWSVQGFDSTGSPTVETYDSTHTPTHFPIIIPPGFVPVPPLGPPFVVPPPGELPDDPDYVLIVVQVFDAGSWDDSIPSVTVPDEPGSAPSRPTPTPSGTADAHHAVIFWQDSTSGPTYEGFDIYLEGDFLPFPDPCLGNNPVWTQGGVDSVPSSLTGISVFGDTCNYDGQKLTCNMWADATCTTFLDDAGGTCQIGQNWDTLFSCTWS